MTAADTQLPAEKGKSPTETALAAAVEAIYFDDNSDYCTALWKVVQALSPQMAQLLEENPQEAFQQTHPELA